MIERGITGKRPRTKAPRHKGIIRKRPRTKALRHKEEHKGNSVVFKLITILCASVSSVRGIIQRIPHAKTPRRQGKSSTCESSSIFCALAPLRELLTKISRAETPGKERSFLINHRPSCREPKVRSAFVRDSSVFMWRFCVIFLFFALNLPVFAQNPAQTAPLANRTVSLEDALKSLGGAGAGAVELRWDPFFSTGALVAGEHKAAFASGRAGEIGHVLLDAKDVLTLPLPFLEGGDIRFPETFLTQVKTTFSRYVEEDRSRFRIAAIIIDPGHGGKDPGASWDYNIRGKTLQSVEKDIVLKVARQLYASLRAAYPEKRLLLTREGDTFPSLEERVVLANSVSLADNEAAIYISVHANSSFNRDARGYEVWYLTPSYRREVIDRSRYADSKEVIPILNSMLEEELTTESILLSNAILKRINEAVGNRIPSRGLKAYDWFVVRNARMPSVLVELGFVSNETDALLMADDAYLKNLSEALYKGITDFVSFFERSGGFTVYQ